MRCWHTNLLHLLQDGVCPFSYLSSVLTVSVCSFCLFLHFLDKLIPFNLLCYLWSLVTRVLQEILLEVDGVHREFPCLCVYLLDSSFESVIGLDWCFVCVSHGFWICRNCEFTFEFVLLINTSWSAFYTLF